MKCLTTIHINYFAIFDSQKKNTFSDADGGISFIKLHKSWNINL